MPLLPYRVHENSLVVTALGWFHPTPVRLDGYFTLRGFEKRIRREQRRLERLLEQVIACVNRHEGGGHGKINIAVESNTRHPVKVVASRRETKAEKRERIATEKRRATQRRNERRGYARSQIRYWLQEDPDLVLREVKRHEKENKA